nr:exoribonuclease [Candidatus Cloacimonadota bacterium]
MKQQIPSHSLQEGTIVLYYDKGHLQLAIIKEVGDKICTLLTETQNQTRINPSRFVLTTSSSFDPSWASLQNFTQKVRSTNFAAISIPQPGMDFATLQDSLNIKDDVKRFALYYFLKDDPATYYQKHELFFQRTAEEKDEYHRLKAKEQERQEYLQQIRNWILDQSQGIDDHFRNQLIEELRLFLQGEKIDDLQKILSANDMDPIKQAIRLRIRLQDDLPNHDPALEASGLPVTFPPAVLDISLDPLAPETINDEAFCIDDEDSKDFDDALSLRELSDGYLLGIHVSNIAYFIKPDDALFDTARSRVSSLYIPSGVVPMLPPIFSEDRFSLIQGHERAVLSLYVRFDQNFEIKSTQIVPQNIIIRENLSYDKVDRSWNEPRFILFRRIAEVLRKQRDPESREQNKRYVYNFKLTEDKIKVKRIDLFSPSRMMIEEMMIYYNRCLAEYAQTHNLPMLFRNIKRFPGREDEPQGSFAFLDTNAAYHPGIGAHGYLHATSPIRRFVDLINQMQIMAQLGHSYLPFSAETLQDMILYIEKRIQLIRITMQRSERYWLLHMIRDEMLNTPLRGIVKGFSEGKYRVDILPWSKQVLVKIDAVPSHEEFSFVAYDIDLDKMLIFADLIY